MQADAAKRIRERWGNKPCDHPNVEKEYQFGADTGDFVCTTCGRIFTRAELGKMQTEKHSPNAADESLA